MIFTLCGSDFDRWVKERVEEHHAKFQEEKYIEMDPEVAEVLKNSTAVSCKYLEPKSSY